MSAESWKLEKDLCRCCHAEGSFHNLSQTRSHLGKEEVYSEMLRSALNIDLSPVSGPLCAKTYTICDGCALRLRDATHFRQQVMTCEEYFKDMYHNVLKTLSPSTNVSIEVKQETLPSCDAVIKVEYPQLDDDDDDNDGFDMQFDDDDDDDDKTVLQMKLEDAKRKAKAKAKPKTKAKKAPKRPRPKKPNADEAGTTGDNEAENPKPKKDRGTHVTAKIKEEIEIECDSSIDHVVGPCEVWIDENPSTSNANMNYASTQYHTDLHQTQSVSGPSKLRTKSAPIKHINKANVMMYVCAKCDAPFKDIHELQDHVKGLHDTDTARMDRQLLRSQTEKKCPICDVFLKNDVVKKLHLYQKHGMEEIKTVRAVSKTVTRPGKYICDICKKDFKTKACVQKHIETVHTRGAKCPDCDIKKRFRGMELAYHRLQVHNADIVHCEICGFIPKYKALLLIHHRRVHLKEKNVSCTKCDMQFFDKEDLSRHMVAHKRLNIYECSFCLKKFSWRKSLIMHEKIHRGEKDEVCLLCDKRFVQKTSLKYHMSRYHPEEC